MLLKTEERKEGPKPFKFELMWLKVEGFKDKVMEWWSSFNFEGDPRFIFGQKLRALKLEIKKWNKEELGRVEERKKKSLKKLGEFDSIEKKWCFIYR